MSRNGSGVYSLPGGSTVTNGDTSDASDLNVPLADIEADLNVARPVVAGGTGATSASAALVNLGLTATAAEINVLDGITSTVAELNVLAGIPGTLTATELGYVDGVTSAIQTQLNAKQASGATLTSLEGLALVQGDTLYATAADTLARLPKGTAAQVLAMNAGATAPEWASASGRTLLASKTAAASSNLSFTEFNNAVYRYYEFVFEAIKPATDAVSLRVRFSTDGGATYDAGGTDYDYAYVGRSAGGTALAGDSAAAGAIELSDATVGNAGGDQGVSGKITVYHAGTASLRTRIGGQLSFDNTSGHCNLINVEGLRDANQDTDAMRFLFSSGDITSGTIRMYGIAE